MLDSTIVYITSNMEDIRFEGKIRSRILSNCGDLPIISVSRKEIDFGQNVCVGEKPVCYANAMRQLLVGLKAAKTRFVHFACADSLYPTEYFSFIPPTDDTIYWYFNVWILYGWTGRNTGTGYWKQYKDDGGAMVCNRLLWIDRLEKCLSLDDWHNVTDPAETFPERQRYGWSCPAPVVNVKTGISLSKYTRTTKETVPMLPVWGDAIQLSKELIHD
jgi:hypothetical protein